MYRRQAFNLVNIVALRHACLRFISSRKDDCSAQWPIRTQRTIALAHHGVSNPTARVNRSSCTRRDVSPARPGPSNGTPREQQTLCPQISHYSPIPPKRSTTRARSPHIFIDEVPKRGTIVGHPDTPQTTPSRTTSPARSAARERGSSI